MQSKFRYSVDNPVHVSVGAVLVNGEGKIRAHRYERARMPKWYSMVLEKLDEMYLLMRETVENDESIEQTLHRGLKEEFGAEGEIVRYLGSIQSLFPENGVTVEKTTIYLEARLTAEHPRIARDSESFSILEWLDPQELLQRMDYQRAHLTRTDMDESKIIRTYLAHAR